MFLKKVIQNPRILQVMFLNSSDSETEDKKKKKRKIKTWRKDRKSNPIKDLKTKSNPMQQELSKLRSMVNNMQKEMHR